jgi:hypothetical protein
MSKIIIDGEPYLVVESLGFVQDIGERAWIVMLPNGSERTAVGTAKNARFWGARDRIRPMVEAIARSKPGDDLYQFKKTDGE